MNFRSLLRGAALTWAATILMCFGAASAWAQHYQQTNLASDVSGLAAHPDADLVNPWGLTRTPTSPWWVSDNGTDKSTLYNGSGAKQGLVVAVPSAPTGVVFNGGARFVVTENNKSGSARFIFDTEDGTILGWSPAVASDHAIVAVNNSATAIYKGLAIATFNGATYLYAANFKSGKVDVFDSTWAKATVPGGFTDLTLPPNYAAFNVQTVGTNIFVTFAKQSGGTDEVHGRGFGFVDEFDSGGNLLMRFQHGPWLNAPWGVALSPANFGQFSNNILIGNFGSGEIAAYDPATGEFLGRLHGPKGTLVIDGLWAIMFGGGTANNGATNELFFTAGIDDENHGLFGKLTPN